MVLTGDEVGGRVCVVIVVVVFVIGMLDIGGINEIFALFSPSRAESRVVVACKCPI